MQTSICQRCWKGSLALGAGRPLACYGKAAAALLLNLPRALRIAGSADGREKLRLGEPPSRSALRLAQAVKPLLHVIELALEIVDLAAGRSRRLFSLGSLVTLPGLGFASRERRKHGKRPLEHFHVPPHLVLQRSERTSAEGLAHVLAKLLLLAGERLNRNFEITRHQHLHAVAIKTNELAQKRNRQKVLASLVLLLEDDLREDGARNILARFGVVDDEILAVFDHAGEILQRQVGARRRTIEAFPCIPSNERWLSGLVHGVGLIPVGCR